MHLKSLKIYCDIVRLGSFSKAAELNSVSQPNASQVIHHLEERLGVQLIDRSRRPFVVTPEGRLYYDGCREVVQRYDELEERVRQMPSNGQERLCVAAIYSVDMAQMHALLEAYRASYPSVNLRVAYMHPDQVYEAVDEGRADLGIVSFPRETDRLMVDPWREERIGLAVAPSHRLASAEKVTAADLRDEALVLPSRGLRLRDEIERYLTVEGATNGKPLRTVAEFDNLESIKRAVEVDEGVALLPEATFANERADGRLVGVSLNGQAPFVRPLGTLRRRDEPLDDPMLSYLALLAKHASESTPAD